MQALVYECPHCGEKVELADVEAEERVHCPNEECGRPFRIQAPEAKLVGRREVEEDEEGGVPATERTLRVVHPAMFRRHPFRWTGLALLLAAGVVGLVYALTTSLAYGTAALVASAAAILIGGGWLLFWWLQTLFVTLTVTDERTILRKGIVAKETSEVRHRDVRNLQLDQNVLERLLGVGDLAISSAGQGDMEIHVDGVPKPDEVAAIVRRHQ